MPICCVAEHVHMMDAERPGLRSHAERGSDQAHDATAARTPSPRLHGRVTQGWREKGARDV